jgi:hypothetical protein
MIYGRFRAGEASAELARIRIDGAWGPLRRGPATAMSPPTGTLTGPGVQGRSILGPAGILRYPSTFLLRATPAPHLLYRPQQRQICQTGNLPAYGTLPAVHLCVGKKAYLQARKIRHLAPQRQERRRNPGVPEPAISPAYITAPGGRTTRREPR